MEFFGHLRYTVREAKRDTKCDKPTRHCNIKIKKGEKYLEVPDLKKKFVKKLCFNCGVLRVNTELDGFEDLLRKLHPDAPFNRNQAKRSGKHFQL